LFAAVDVSGLMDLDFWAARLGLEFGGCSICGFHWSPNLEE
jgi:hypothetical protein